MGPTNCYCIINLVVLKISGTVELGSGTELINDDKYHEGMDLVRDNT